MTFEMPLDGLEQANKQRSEQSLKLARSVIEAASGPFVNENHFWSPLYGLIPQETPGLKTRKKTEKIINKLWPPHSPILVEEVNAVRRSLRIGQVGSFNEEEFQPYRFSLDEGGRFIPWKDDIVVTGSLEVAINELETTSMYSRHQAENFGFTDSTEPIEVARIKTLYADRGVYQLDELVGGVYVGMNRIIRASGKLGDFAVRLVEDYYLAEAEQREQRKHLRRIS